MITSVRNILLLSSLIVFVCAVLAAVLLHTHYQAEGENKLLACGTVADFWSEEVLAEQLGITNNITGKQLFRENCSQCHAFQVKVVGPALGGVTDIRNKAWLQAFISNPAKLIESGDSAAVALYREFKQYMPSNDHLTAAAIDSVISYLKYESEISKHR